MSTSPGVRTPSGESRLWRAERPLLLASTSATRRGLLEAVGLPVEVAASNLDERAWQAAQGPLTPAALARGLARAKAEAVAARHPDRIVLGADQTLDLDGQGLHKPGSRAEAADQLARLAGRSHILHSAFALAVGGVVGHEGADEARLTLRPLDAAAIARYLDLLSDDVLAGIGVYQIEGVGLHLFSAVEGAHSTILGLPLLPLLACLRGLDLLAF